MNAMMVPLESLSPDTCLLAHNGPATRTSSVKAERRHSTAARTAFIALCIIRITSAVSSSAFIKMRSLTLPDLREAFSAPFRRKNALPSSRTAPILPQIDFGFDRDRDRDRDPDPPEENDMNGSTWNYEDAVRSTNKSTPPPQARRAMPSYTSPRNVSGPLAVDTNVLFPETNATTSPWQRSNPHAAPAPSKTSQFIDKITAENERLRRELTAEKLARETESQRVSAAHTRAQDSQAEHQRLQVLVETNERAIERKDRKIEELKAALETETKRRQTSEQRADEALKMLGDTRSETQRLLAAAYEQKHYAESQLDAARDGYKRITDGQEKQVKTLRDEMRELKRQRAEDADKIKRRDIISDQLQHEMAKTSVTEGRMTDMMGTYKREHRKEVDALVEQAEQFSKDLPSKSKRAAALVDEMEETRDKMKWVMAQKQRSG